MTYVGRGYDAEPLLSVGEVQLFPGLAGLCDIFNLPSEIEEQRKLKKLKKTGRGQKPK